MMAILALTVAAGVVVNVSLHRTGVATLPARYAAATAASYVVFLALVRLWLAHLERRVGVPARETRLRRRRRSRLEDTSDILDASDLAGDVASALPDGATSVADAFPASSPSSGGGGGLDLVPDLDEGAVVLAVIAGALLLVSGSALYLLWYAPAILADAAVSVLVASMLARTSRASRASGWFPRVVRSTAGPFALAMVVLVAAGWALQSAVPDATRLVDVVAALRD